MDGVRGVQLEAWT